MMRRGYHLGISLFSVLPMLALFALNAIAEEAAAPAPLPVNTGDNAWVLASSALVLAMTAPGLALFYGGMAKAKNMVNTLWMSFICICIVSLMWVLWTYSLSFAPCNWFLGGLQWVALGLGTVGQEPSDLYATTIPHLSFMIFQCMFAIITVALVSGAIVERLKFGAWLLFILLWGTVVYCPIAHWVWGVDGWLYKFGALDFAGGTVVHISSGASALIFCLFLGRRRKILPPHNVPATMIGAALLWFGWFGFNAGSAVAASGLASSAFVVTNTAAAAAAFTWNVMEWIFQKKPTLIGACSGAVAGLVAITPASGFVGPMASIAIGVGAGTLCYSCVVWMKKALGYDDALDVVGIHAMGGSWGALATGIFCSKLVNPAGADGAIYGNVAQLGKQFIGVLASWGWACAVTALLVLFIKVVCRGARPSEAEEVAGMDISQHKEIAYHYIEPETNSVRS